MTNNDLHNIVTELKEYLKQSIKGVLTMDEASQYLGISKQHLYRLTSARAIPHSKPSGKLIYFAKADLERWAMRNKIASNDEATTIAANYLIKQVLL